MPEQWFRLDWPAAARPALVLDAAAGSARLWPVLRSLLEGVQELLPPPARPAVAFLGGDEFWTLDEFLAQADRLEPANRGRARVLAPLARVAGRPLVVIAAGPVFDRDDWLGEITYLAPGSISSVDDLAAIAHRPLARVSVTAASAIASAWDETAFTWTSSGLTADTAEPLPLRVAFLATEAVTPRATATRADGVSFNVPVVPCAGPATPAPKRLTGADFTVLEQWRLSGTPGTLPPGLQDWKEAAFIRIEMGTFDAKATPIWRPVLPFAGGAAAAVKMVGGVTVHRPDPTTGQWRPTGETWANWQPLGERAYALVV